MLSSESQPSLLPSGQPSGVAAGMLPGFQLSANGVGPASGGDVRFIALASGSKGNCSAIVMRHDGVTRTVLIDLGIHPKRANQLLIERGVPPHSVECALLTHLDSDHAHPAWCQHLPRHATIRMHKTHAGRAGRQGMLFHRSEPFDGAFWTDPVGGIHVDPVMMSHDEQGVASFRFTFACGGTMGFATDLGRATQKLIDHMKGVDVLVIESNYCPILQQKSNRPAFLKRRIMNGSGHLSNEQCLEAVRAIEPREHVVLIHLSQECNRPELVLDMHAGADYALTVATQDEPTRWVRLGKRIEVQMGSAMFAKTATDTTMPACD